MLLPILFYLISTASTASCVLLGIGCSRNDGLKGRALSATMLTAGIVNLTYMLSTLPMGYQWCSVFSSMYFSSVDLMLFALLVFTTVHTRVLQFRQAQRFLNLVGVIALVDILQLLLNPLTGFVVDYVPRDTLIAPFEYNMHLPFKLHLGFSYAVVVIVLVMYLFKVLTTPLAYRSQYTLTVLGIMAVVSINAIFLFTDSSIAIAELDYSVWCYSLVCFILYWTSFEYTTHGMLNHLRTWVVESIGQGIALFDNNNELILKNTPLEKMLSGCELTTGMELQAFIQLCGLPDGSCTDMHEFSIQTYLKTTESERPVQCDFRVLRDRRGLVMGRLFVMTDATGERDILTGFHNWQSFRATAVSTSPTFAYPVVVAVCDINGLQEINNTMGRNTGDKAICRLAECMKRNFPQGTYFIRGREASLMALCYHTNEEEVQIRLNAIDQTINEKNESNVFLSIQYAMATGDGTTLNLREAVMEAFHSLQAKKLMDNHSKSSAMLHSLTQALQESDADTEAHMVRTQQLGANLGRRLKLSDPQLSNLSLLCIMHDIGKIGIPLQILNKPDHLTDDEWQVMRSHVEKGYQICKASQELSGIADMVLHHHERWDGKGYPDGLTRESIPLLSRIISVVDSYDAMTNNRIYRPAMSVEAALNELRANAGTQFDPGIVAEFTRMIEEDPPESTPAPPRSASIIGPSRVFSQPLLSEEDLKGQAHVFDVRYGRYIVGEKGRIIECDEGFTHLTGYTQQDIAAGMYQVDLIPESDRPEYMMRLLAQDQTRPVIYLEHRLCRKDGSMLYVFCSGHKHFDPVNRRERDEVLIFDSYDSFAVRLLRADERRRAQSRLKRWQEHYRCDSLTSLLSHDAFRNDVDQRLLDTSMLCILVMIDVDHFKQYNDTYGHQAGDEYLILVANAINSAIAPQDLACRMGGDEFAVAMFLPADASDTLIRDKATHLYDSVSSVLHTGTSLSMGCAVNRAEGWIFNDLYRTADAALYQAKENGRSRIVINTNRESGESAPQRTPPN